MNFQELIEAILNNNTEKLPAELLSTSLPQVKTESPITITFSQFLERQYPQGKHNLYIIWHGKQALYVGISKSDVWGRWFTTSYSHMYFAGGVWSGNSPIGTVIQRNFPKSLKWKVELRHYSTSLWSSGEDLEAAEHRLIVELRPLFNTTYRPSLT